MTATITNATTTRRIAIESITITRAEGPAADCGKPTIHSTWTDAEARIQHICRHAPTDGTYFKTDFAIRYRDGNLYEGRYDAAHPTSKVYEPTLSGHVRSHLEYVAGLAHPKHLTEAQYESHLDRLAKDRPGMRDEALAFLTKYALTDEAPCVTPAAALQHVAVVVAPSSMGDTTPVTKGPAMSTTATPPMTPRDAHDAALAINAGKALKPVVCVNSWPLKGVFYSLGGQWDKALRQWCLPEHTHAEGQRIATEYDAKGPKAATVRSTPPQARPGGNPQAPALAGMTPLGMTPAPAAPTATPKPAKAVLKAKGAPKAAPLMDRRLAALLTGAKAILADLPATDARYAALYAAVQLIERVA